MISSPGDCFIVDTTSSIYLSASFLGRPSYLYDRVPGITLGEERGELTPYEGQDIRLCFNCGSPDHTVASCPEPTDRQVVSLSRQLFNFLHPDLIAQETTRFYVAEGWRQQRFEWLRFYEPGVIHGPLLRDALGLREGDVGSTVEWLRNMAHWGYPPGWVGCRDPRQLVYSRILGEEKGGRVPALEWEPFTIFEGSDDDEEIDLRLFDLGNTSTTSAVTGSSTTSVERIRWATYPGTYFSSTALSVYDGTSLGSVTFTPERRALWEHILRSGLGSNNTLSVPPWRLPGAFGTSAAKVVVEDFVLPPPTIIPLSLPLIPHYPLSLPESVSSRASAPSSRSDAIDDVVDDSLIVDMDMSDDSE